MSRIDYIVCPKCGNEMILINNKWCCRTCGHTISLGETDPPLIPRK